MGISKRGMYTFNSLVEDSIKRILGEAKELLKFTGKRTLDARAIQTSVALVFPGELSKHATTEGVKAVGKYYASQKHLQTLIFLELEAKHDEFFAQNLNTATAKSLIWLYTKNSWVYEEINALLREDSPLLSILSPVIKGLMVSYSSLSDHYYSGLVYRKTNLSDKMLSVYKPGYTFVWSAFTSCASKNKSLDPFGEILFVIEIPQQFKEFAISLEDLSAFPGETEVLLSPCVGYQVISVENQGSGNTKVTITLKVFYVCIT